jgi:hypothetical protein
VTGVQTCALPIFILLHYKEERKDAVSIERYICEHFRTFEFDIATRQRLANVISFVTTWTGSIVTKLINRIAAARKDHALSSQISHPREDQSIMKWLDNVNRLQQGEELPARNYDQYGTLTAEGATIALRTPTIGKRPSGRVKVGGPRSSERQLGGVKAMRVALGVVAVAPAIPGAMGRHG